MTRGLDFDFDRGRKLLTRQCLSATLHRGTAIAGHRVRHATLGGIVKKAIKLEMKAAPTKKASLKAAVKKTASAVSPKLASNHNETILISE